jgi:hypothetical protein
VTPNGIWILVALGVALLWTLRHEIAGVLRRWYARRSDHVYGSRSPDTARTRRAS